MYNSFQLTVVIHIKLPLIIKSFCNISGPYEPFPLFSPEIVARPNSNPDQSKLKVNTCLYNHAILQSYVQTKSSLFKHIRMTVAALATYKGVYHPKARLNATCR
ncbi:hypothetical protein EYC80_005889 [Monilinia laxa]|uniref:Uncharacterized protein n=1 Tax=Monilinia laxa TaxID=61186 RepID=A0A5N6KFM3_MONLA|nr:hypothetical protein EYC80_005889 [Monilinia laxa]